MTPAQIEDIERSASPQRTVKIYAPVSGHLCRRARRARRDARCSRDDHPQPRQPRQALGGSGSSTSATSHVRAGMPVRVEVEAFPGRYLARPVRLLRPRGRSQDPHAEGFCRDGQPGPEAACRDVRQSFCARRRATRRREGSRGSRHSQRRAQRRDRADAAGAFEPREVELGPAGGGFQEIRAGVEAGETVVTSSQFLIDSESNLKAAIQQARSGDPASATVRPRTRRRITTKASSIEAPHV